MKLKLRKKLKGYLNKIRKAIIKASRPTASVRAKLKIAYLKSSSRINGFLERARRKLPQTIPTPTPAPVNPIVANPAPTSLNASFVIFDKKKKYIKQTLK
jgi:hypothetical protein